MPIPAGAVALGIGSGVAGLATGLLGVDSQNRANAENARYNRELLAFQRYQYEDQKRYNSIVEQARRMRAAGFNPALMMQNGTLGTAGSQVGSPSMIPQQPLDIGSIGSAISQIAGVGIDAVSSYARAAKDIEESIGQQIKNSYSDDLYKWDIDNKKALSYMQGLQGEVNLQSAKFLQQSMGDRLMQEKWRSEMVRADAGLKLVASSYAEGEHASNIYNKLALAYSAVLTGQASVKQAFAALKNAMTNENNSKALYGLDDNDRADFFEAALDQLDTASELNRSSAFHNQFFNNETHGSVLYGLGSLGHTTVSGRGNEYENWKKDLRARRDERRKRRAESRKRGIIK